jgi:DNA-binding Xre family transcriptional regulator
MNDEYYAHILDSFLEYHPYMKKELHNWRPRGEWGIRVTLLDGSEYDYDTITNGIRRVVNHRMNNMEDITEERCRASISYHLTELMALRGFSQNTLSEYTGLSKGSINNYINGTSTPSATALRKLARALDCNITDLLD